MLVASLCRWLSALVGGARRVFGGSVVVFSLVVQIVVDGHWEGMCGPESEVRLATSTKPLVVLLRTSALRLRLEGSDSHRAG
jgi:hypothetical protein